MGYVFSEDLSYYIMGIWPMFRQLLLRVEGKYRVALTLIQSSIIGFFNSGSLNSVRLRHWTERSTTTRYMRDNYWRAEL